MESGGGEGDNDFSSDFLPPAATRHLYSLLGATSLQEAFIPANKKSISRSLGNWRAMRAGLVMTCSKKNSVDGW